ncbi:MAG TPA: hypothetical protein VII75_11880 [Thermoanaerobaculia bacterium]|nr:hypothetical protein [Thermoanaerobaculia bacterium]
MWKTLRPGGLLYLDEYVGPTRFEWNETPLPIVPDDPTEALRSSHIERYLRLGFDVRHARPYGGAVLATVFGNLHTALIDDDRAVTNAIGSHHTVFVAVPRRLPLIALLRYRIDTKLRRLWKERGRLVRSRRASRPATDS